MTDIRDTRIAALENEINDLCRHNNLAERYPVTGAATKQSPAAESPEFPNSCCLLAENALRASEALNRSIIESTVDCIKVLDLEGKLLEMPNGPRVLGIDCIPFLNTAWVEFWKDGDAQAAQAAVKAAATGKTQRFVGMFRTQQNEDRWWDLAVSPILNSSGKPEKLLVVSRDVTGRKQAEDDLRQRSMQFKTLMDEAPLGIYLIDADFRIQHVNRKALAVFGDIAHLIGRDLAEVLHIIWPAARADETMAQFRRTMETGVNVYVEKLMEKRADRDQVEHYEWQISRIELPDGSWGVVCYFRDISERVAAQLKISESEWRLRYAADSAGLTYVEFDFTSGQVSTPENFPSVMGYAPPRSEGDAMRGAQVLMDRMHPQDRGHVATALQEFFSGKPVGTLNYRVVGDDRQERWIETKWSTLSGVNGKPLKSFAINVDITQRKVAEKALRLSEERFRALVTASSDVVYRMSPDWVEMRQLDGQNFLADTLQANSNWLADYIHPDDQANVMAVVDEAIRTKSLFEMEHQVLRMDGSLGWTFSHAVPMLDPAGEIVEWFGTASDVTEDKRAAQELEESQDRYRILFNSIDEGFCVIEVLFDDAGKPVDYRFVEVNPSCEKQSGLTNAKGKRMREFVPDLDASWFEIYGKVVLTGEPIRFENEATEMNNNWFDVYAFRIGDAADCKVAVLFTNITERKQAQQQLLALTQTLAEQDRRKDEFLAMLGHELRNPLAAISNAMHLLRLEKDETPMQRQARQVIERQTGQLTCLVDDLLEVSRITSGQVQLRREHIAMAGIIERAVETAQPLIAQRRHALNITLAPKPLWLNADASRLEQVVVNLLNNAAKYTKDGGRIDLSVEQENEFAVLRVNDTGIGMAPELLPSIFELFTQAARSLDRSEGGLGIGLCLVQRLVELHGGSVTVQSTPGQGSEFTVRLPLVQTEVAPPAPAVLVAAPAAPLATARRILVVDDNIDAAETLKMMLELSSHKVAMAHEGLSALETARAWSPDVIFLDIGLPGLNGYEVAKQIRLIDTLKSVVLVALTGYGQASDRQLSLEAGFDHHLVKPTNFDMLEKILDPVAAGQA